MCSILSKAFASQQLQFAITVLDGLVTSVNAQSQLCVVLSPHSCQYECVAVWQNQQQRKNGVWRKISG